MFTSHNCDEEPRRLLDGKSYNLTWNGQILPKLCSFSFNAQNGEMAVCFQSTIFNLDRMDNVQLKITNYTRKKWVCI